MTGNVKCAATFEKEGKTLTICLKRDLDHHSEIGIREAADRLLEDRRIRNIIFDFSGIEFMDSSGIGVIMGRYKKVAFGGGRIAVACIGKNIERIMQMSGMFRFLERYDTAEDAREAFACVKQTH